MPTNQQRALLQLVREVSRRQIAPRALHQAPGAAFPAELFALLAELDLLGLPFSSDEGGLGQPTTIVCQVLAELSQAFLAVGLGTWVHLLATRIVADHAGAALRHEVLPQLIAGEWLAAHALAVPSATHAGPPSVRMERQGDAYVLNGSLTDVAQAGQADWYVLVGRRFDRPGDDGTVVLVSAATAGLECSAPGRATAVGGAASGPLTCRDVRVPVHHRLGAEGQGGMITADAIDAAHIGVAACAVGLARAGLTAVVAGLRAAGRRAPRAGGGHDVASMIADISAAVEAADALCERAASAQDAGRAATGLAAMARIFATDTAVEIADRTVDIHAGTGSAATRPLERYRRDATALLLVDGGDGAARRAVADEVLGTPDDDDGR